jgi:hypothetical protein
MDKLNDNYSYIIKEIKKKFKINGLKANSGIQLIEEKFRLDIYNSVMNIIYPKQSKFNNDNK